MGSQSLSDASLVGLFRELTDEIKILISKEAQLAKSEMAEKVSGYSRNAVTLALGGFVAYAGLIVLLAGLGLLIGWGLQGLGWNATVADFAGLAIAGIIIITVGAVMALNARKAFATMSLAPEQTIGTFRQITGGRKLPEPTPTPQRSPAELKPEILAVGQRVEETWHEVAHRTTPAGIKERAVKKAVNFKNRTLSSIREHPMRWSALALGSGLTALLIWQKRRAS